MGVYGVILTVIIGLLFGYRFVGSIAYQVGDYSEIHDRLLSYASINRSIIPIKEDVVCSRRLLQTQQ